jgi:hypothetical protein
MKKPRKTVARTAYATWHPEYGLNNHWVRPSAKAIRDENGAYWQNVKSRGWRIVRVKVAIDRQ